jgi:transposase
MLLLREIYPETLSLLRRIYRSSKHHQVRQRAQFLILYSQGQTLAQLMPVFSVTLQTLYNWINTWESRGILGLYNQPGRGRKRLLTPEQEEQIYRWVQESPIQLNRVLAQIKETWDITISKKTLKRILKRLSMSWHRFRRGTAGTPDILEYQEKQQQLEELKQQDAKGEIALYFMDESGFCLIPCVPYGWQPVGQYLELLSCMSKRLNVLGFLRYNLELETYVSEQTINSDVVIHCIEQFFGESKIPVVIAMDQASIHTSNAMYFKRQEWEERGIALFELPTYSPHLNLIEHLWKFMKYYWIEITAYHSWDALVEYVERVLREFGDQYIINFV